MSWNLVRPQSPQSPLSFLLSVSCITYTRIIILYKNSMMLHIIIFKWIHILCLFHFIFQVTHFYHIVQDYLVYNGLEILELAF